VIGFGGYPSIPFVLAAQLLRIDTILHEQNAVIGKANKFLFKMAKLTMLSFPIFPCPRNSTITGAPTRFEHMYDHFLYSPSVQNQFKILVLGGGQGSQNVSNSVLKSLAKMPKKALQNITVHHQAIKSDLDMVRKFYHQYGVKSNVQPFFSQIDDMYKDVDLVISRSGASTIFEIIGFKIPSILIPYEHSINGDQAANAQILRNVGAAVVCPDGDIFEALITLYNDRALLQKMSQNYLSLYIPCSTKKITELIADIITPQ
jgi:UDP-N-acetylglucosamine--N-acetylmuramyl-(pentapeptide) pyrophosphoryl-undecaprenol N-acetylglucosamine transferase